MTRPVVLSIGDIVVDLIASVSFPIEPDRVIMTDRPLLEAGGACNFGIAAARLGLNCKLLGAPGADPFGDLVIRILQSEGVDTSLVRQPADFLTTLVLVLADLSALRQTYISAAVGSEYVYLFDDQVRAAINTADALYYQGYTLRENHVWTITRQSLSEAYGKIPVYFDPSPLLANAPEDRRMFALEHADVILTTEDELTLLVPSVSKSEQVVATLLKDHIDTLVIKRNVEGCRVVTRDGSQDFPAYPVNAISAVAAGDAFNAGFIAARLRGLSLEDSARIANATGAAKVQRLGGGRNVPHLEDVRAVLQANGVNLTLDGWADP